MTNADVFNDPSGAGSTTPANTRQATRFDFFAGSQERTTQQPGGKIVYGRRQVQGHPDLIYWFLEIRDVRGGLGVTYGDFDWTYDRASSAVGVDTRFPRSLILAQQTTTSATPDPTGNLSGLHSCHAFDTMFMAAGSGANVALVKETSTTNAAPTAITYSPGSAITCLEPITINNAVGVVIGRTGAVPQLMTDATGTISGTAFDASLNPTYGVIQTPLNDRSSLFLANDRIRRVVASGAVSQTPTIAEAVSWPNGGYRIGMLRLDNGPLRAYWGLPFEATTNGVLLFGTEKYHRFVSCNLEGSDQQDHDFGFPVGILQAALIPSHLAAVGHDGETMRVMANGVETVPTFVDRVPDSDREYRIRNMWVNGNEVIYEVNFRASPSGSGSTVRHWESYDLNTGAVHQISADVTLSGTGSFGILSSGAAPLSRYTRNMQFYSDGSWRRMVAPRYGENPYLLARQTSGAGASTGNDFEASGTWKSPNFELPDLEGLPKVVKRVTMLGDIQSGGTASTAAHAEVTITNTPVAHFTTAQAVGVPQVERFYDNKSTFYQMQVQIDLARTTASTKFTPNPLPIRIEGYAFRNTTEEARMLPSDSEIQAMFSEGR